MTLPPASRGPRVWITRAEPGAARTAARLAALGFEPVVAPLLLINALPQSRPDLMGVTALAFTSPNGVVAFAALTPDRSRPVLAVGDATAAAAVDAGFTDVASAAGDLTALAALVRDRGFAAEDVILNVGALEPAGDLGAAVGPSPVVRRLPVYEARETGITPPKDCLAVLVHSPRAGRALAQGPAPLTPERVIAVAISPAAAAPLSGLGFAGVHAAPHPDENSLLATLGKALSPV